MLTEIELQNVIQLSFKYLNDNLSIDDIDELGKEKGLELPFSKYLGKISENKTIVWENNKYLWKEINQKVRGKIRAEKIQKVLKLAILYLDSDLSMADLLKLEEGTFSSSSLQRYFNELIPEIPIVNYQGKEYTGAEFKSLLQKKMAEKKQAAPQKGGISSSIKTSALKDSNGRFIGSKKKDKIAGKYSGEVYERAIEEANLFRLNHSSTRLVAKRQDLSKETIRRDFHKVLKDSNPTLYQQLIPQLKENKDVAIDDSGRYIDAEEKYRRKK